MADVDVLGRQEVNHVHDERRDPYQNHVLSDPPRVVVQRVLKFRRRLFTLRDYPKAKATSLFINRYFQGSFTTFFSVRVCFGRLRVDLY